LPLTVYDGKKNLVTTAQFFALWRAVGEVSGDPAAGLKIATQIDVGDRPTVNYGGHYARDYRDALTRLARFKQTVFALNDPLLRQGPVARGAMHQAALPSVSRGLNQSPLRETRGLKVQFSTDRRGAAYAAAAHGLGERRSN